MRAYKVFLIVKTGRDTDHCALFFETAVDHKGTIVQVTRGGRGGEMRLQRQTESALDASTWDDDRKDHIGWIMEEKFHWVWTVVRSVPPPGKEGGQCRTSRQWTEKVMQALQAQGVMENCRESEATVHHGGDDDDEEEEEEEEEDDDEEAETETDVSTEELGQTRRARHVFVARQESDSETSEEE